MAWIFHSVSSLGNLGSRAASLLLSEVYRAFGKSNVKNLNQWENMKLWSC